MDCDVFKAKILDKRKEYVKTEKLCFNCFSKGHSLKDCNSKYRCRVNNCNKKHSPLIHYETVSSNSLGIKGPLTNINSDNCKKINQTVREKSNAFISTTDKCFKRKENVSTQCVITWGIGFNNKIKNISR